MLNISTVRLKKTKNKLIITILCTIDVVELYRHVPHNKGFLKDHFTYIRDILSRRTRQSDHLSKQSLLNRNWYIFATDV